MKMLNMGRLRARTGAMGTIWFGGTCISDTGNECVRAQKKMATIRKFSPLNWGGPIARMGSPKTFQKENRPNRGWLERGGGS